VCKPAKNTLGWQRVRFETTKGSFTVQLRPDLAPHGYQHFVELIEAGYYTARTQRVPFFSKNPDTVMFGAVEIIDKFKPLRAFPNSRNGQKDTNPCKTQRWEKGVVAMMGGPHVLIVIKPNDRMGKNDNDAPTGYVTEGMDVVEQLYAYDSREQQKAGSNQQKIMAVGGAEFLKSHFPKLDYITAAHILEVVA